MIRSDSRSHTILQEISAGDYFVGFLCSARSTKQLYRVAQKRAQEKYKNKQVILKLKALGYVAEKDTEGTPSFFITEEGKRALHKVYTQVTAEKISTKKWDGQWRVVTYDFPESKRSIRNSLRYVLEKAQFIQIQKSVWLSPFDSKPLEDLIAHHETAKKYVVFMLVHSITNSTRFKKHFHLT
jgi:DNA-binding transcriptional regulator PaaX